jgi:hypothetical protein
MGGDPMNFNSIEDLKKEGFEGFFNVGHLFEDSSMIPEKKGVYLVLYLDKENPKFSEKNRIELYGGKNLNYSVSNLSDRWVEDTIVINIGQAGGKGSNATLKTRINQYLNFGKAKNATHRGGRSIWQIKNYQDLVICWKPTPGEDPKKAEESLIQEFKKIYGKKPFANDPDERR